MRQHPNWGFFILVILYLGLTSLQINDPFMDDETWEFYAAKTLEETGNARVVTGATNVYHPHGYYFVLSTFFRLFGASEFSARLVGILATLACAWVLRSMVRTIAQDRPAAELWCATFYLFSPLVIQGSLIITADTAIHHLAISSMLLFVVKRMPFGGRKDYFLLGLMFAGCLWIKIISPCFVIFALALYHLLKKDWIAFREICITTGLGGMLLFASSWAAYCVLIGENYTTAFTYLLGVADSRAQVPSLSSKVVWLARMGIVSALWLGIPYLLLITLSLFRKHWRRGLPESIGALLTVGTVLLFVFTFVAGAAYGFPRYHFTVLPIWAVICGLFVESEFKRSKLNPSTALWCTVGSAFFLIFAVGDPLYAVNFDLKIALAKIPGLASDPASLKSVVTVLALAAIPTALAIAWCAVRRSPARLAALAACLTVGTSLSIDTLQAIAPYQTHLSYGEMGTRDLHEYLRSRILPGYEIIAGKDIVYHVLDHGYQDDYRWSEQEFIENRLRNPRTQFLVLGTQHNTTAQLREALRTNGYSNLLRKHYTRQQIGSYFVWERNLLGNTAQASEGEPLKSQPR